MATAFRAMVMLMVLVGLPAVWVYYGPLPPAAMGVIERTLATAQQSLGWNDPASPTPWATAPPKTAPRFEAVSPAHASRPSAHLTTRAPSRTTSTQPMQHDSQFSLTSASLPAAERTPPMTVGPELTRQLEPHLSLLQSLGAAEYTLESWGGEAQLYRFRCAIALGEQGDHTRQFESVRGDPLSAVRQIVGEVTAWQNARTTMTIRR
jgi:hypothetical protein